MTRPPRGRAIASSTEMLVLRDRLGFGRHRKSASRDPEKRAMLLEMALRRIDEAERDNFVPIGFRRRRVRFG